MSRMKTLAAAVLATCCLYVTAATAAPAPEQLGKFDAWIAFSSGTGAGKSCFVLTQPTASEPTTVRRDPIFFIITNYPSRKVTGEPSVVPGYRYKEGSAVFAQVGTERFEFFTRNEGTDGDGGAWIETREQEAKLLEAMRKGSTMVVSGTSRRGTNTTDTYSLKGLSAALAKIDEVCKP